jgi:hypothetical protein
MHNEPRHELEKVKSKLQKTLSSSICAKSGHNEFGELLSRIELLASDALGSPSVTKERIEEL